MAFPLRILAFTPVMALCGLMGWLAPTTLAEDFQGSMQAVPFDEPPISYRSQTPNDPIAKLREALEQGAQKLNWDAEYGYLPAVLEALGVPAASQMLVFSKTSLQRRDISPENPRALYFNDDVYVGYIPGAEHLELMGVDPKLGSMFYTLAQEKVRKPKVMRDEDCLRCHGTGRSMGVPGPIVRSIATDASGELVAGTEAEQMNHCTPLAERWAGWYVTGTHGTQTHRGNLVGAAAFTKHEQEPNYMGNLRELTAFFPEKKYPAKGSDIVALMVLEHQAHMHNYITRLNFETQTMMATYGHIRYLKQQVNAFLRYLLFTEEAPLTEPVEGEAAFVQAFAQMGPRDRKGRSLRDFDLQRRMFKYPCSYLVYSNAFEQMPEVMKSHLLERLYAILTGKDADPQFAGIKVEDRQAVLEILRETKPSLPAYWRE